MKKLIHSSILLIAVLSFAAPPARAQQKKMDTTDDTRAYLEMLRSDYNATKVRTINQVMKLTAPEAEAFWPIYRAYEKEMGAIGDQKLALIREFFAHDKDGTLDDKNSNQMAKAWFKNTQARLDLWKKYYRKISKALSPIRAAQFLQVENQMALFVDMSIASEMPEIAPSKPQSPPK